MGIVFNGDETNCAIFHFRYPTDEQLRQVDIFFSNYYNLQSVHFELPNERRHRMWKNHMHKFNDKNLTTHRYKQKQNSGPHSAQL